MSTKKIAISGYLTNVFARNFSSKTEIEFLRFRDEKLHQIEKLTGRKIPISMLDEITKLSQFSLSDIVRMLENGTSIEDICETLNIKIPCTD